MSKRKKNAEQPRQVRANAVRCPCCSGWKVDEAACGKNCDVSIHDWGDGWYGDYWQGQCERCYAAEHPEYRAMYCSSTGHGEGAESPGASSAAASKPKPRRPALPVCLSSRSGGGSMTANEDVVLAAISLPRDEALPTAWGKLLRGLGESGERGAPSSSAATAAEGFTSLRAKGSVLLSKPHSAGLDDSADDNERGNKASRAKGAKKQRVAAAAVPGRRSDGGAADASSGGGGSGDCNYSGVGCGDGGSVSVWLTSSAPASGVWDAVELRCGGSGDVDDGGSDGDGDSDGDRDSDDDGEGLAVAPLPVTLPPGLRVVFESLASGAACGLLGLELSGGDGGPSLALVLRAASFEDARVPAAGVAAAATGGITGAGAAAAAAAGGGGGGDAGAGAGAGAADAEAASRVSPRTSLQHLKALGLVLDAVFPHMTARLHSAALTPLSSSSFSSAAAGAGVGTGAASAEGTTEALDAGWMRRTLGAREQPLRPTNQSALAAALRPLVRCG